MKTSERLVTVREAAARTGRKVSTWRKDILKRRVPYVKIGRSVRIPVEFIERVIREGWRDPIEPGEFVP
jgi:excisionase family DNA binding protein